MKSMLLTVLCALSFGASYSQPSLYRYYDDVDHKGDKELSFSFGRRSGTELIGLHLLGSGVYEDGGYQNISSIGTFFATFRMFIRKKTAWGLTFGAQSISYNYHNIIGGKLPRQPYAAKATLLALAIEQRRIFLERQSYELYTLAGIGVRMYSETETSGDGSPSLPKFFIDSQWSFLGVQVGRKIKGFVELGFGYKGLINFGTTFALGPKKNNGF